jgi:hypothetical protein
VEQKLGLLVHWLAYLVVNTGLLIAAGGFDGSLWRILGWGVGLAVHTGYVLADVGYLQRRLVEREIRHAQERA